MTSLPPDIQAILNGPVPTVEELKVAHDKIAQQMRFRIPCEMPNPAPGEHCPLCGRTSH